MSLKPAVTLILPGTITPALLAAGIPKLAAQNLFTAQQIVMPAAGLISGSVSLNLGNLPASTGVTWALNQPATSNNLRLNVTADVTSITITNGTDGAIYNILLIVGSGGHAIPGTMTNVDWGAAGAPTWTTASARNFMSGYWDDADGLLIASARPG